MDDLHLFGVKHLDFSFTASTVSSDITLIKEDTLRNQDDLEGVEQACVRAARWEGNAASESEWWRGGK